MPKFSDLEYIRNEILQVGNEKETLDEWGETFDPLPLPPNTDADDAVETKQGKDLGVNTVSTQPEISETYLPPDTAPQKQKNEKADVFTDILSSINLDSKAGNANAQTETLEVPEEYLSEEHKPAAETVSTDALPEFDEDLTKHDGPSIFTDGAEINDSLFDSNNYASEEPLEKTTSGNETPPSFEDLPDLDALDFGNRAHSDENASPETANTHDISVDDLPDLDNFDFGNITQPETVETEPSAVKHSGGLLATAANRINAADTGESAAATDFDVPIAEFNFDDDNGQQESPSTESEAATEIPDTDADLELDALSKPEYTETHEIPDSDSTPETTESTDGETPTSSETGETDDAYKPVEELKNVEIPEIDEKTGFAKKDDEPDNHSFAPPKRFETFADTAGQAFVTPKKSETSGADMEGDVPLAISEQDFKKFLKELNAMPLNLRQEIQHYIAYDDDLEVNKMELVDLIVKGASLNKVVKYLEVNLKKSIKIPKGFDKKSFEEFEREKKTFKYRFRHQILPLLTIAGIITLLICSVLVIGWHFIYKPVMAEQYYKDGLFYIESGNTITAFEKFDKAGSYRKKKRWYFRYADAFREKKQYAAAEQIYLRLLTDFNHDVEGGIAYSDMLSRELRDYQKAETVLRRQVLDYHPQSELAFYTLANVYLEWGLEDAAKLEEAKKIFDRLLLHNGSNDAYHAGLMKYYIRTNNLAKVLPFKDYFLNKGRKLSQADFNELAGYLITCRYEPSPHITTAQKNEIDDLREVLERALKLNEADAEANYNLGRFFVYNYKNEEAEYYLKKAYENYGSGVLPLNQFFKKIDAMRLYGEIFLKKEQHLEAETIFSNALNVYRSYAAISELPPNKAVGKLFEDYGDIKYFIASDYELALESFAKAVEQHADSSELRYKMGYINYASGNYNQAAIEFAHAFADKSTDANLLFALGNALFKRADYYAAQAYYERLLETLEAEKFRRKIILPQVRENDTLFVENYMKASNNLAVTLNRLAVQNGNSEMNSRSFMLFAESTRAWDALTRNPKTLIRTKNQQSPAYVNVQYMTAPNKNFVPEIYTDIPLTLENERVLMQVQ